MEFLYASIHKNGAFWTLIVSELFGKHRDLIGHLLILLIRNESERWVLKTSHLWLISEEKSQLYLLPDSNSQNYTTINRLFEKNKNPFQWVPLYYKTQIVYVHEFFYLQGKIMGDKKTPITVKPLTPKTHLHFHALLYYL